MCHTVTPPKKKKICFFSAKNEFNLREMFSKRRERSHRLCILVEGSPGYGKTTLARNIAVDWGMKADVSCSHRKVHINKDIFSVRRSVQARHLHLLQGFEGKNNRELCGGDLPSNGPGK